MSAAEIDAYIAALGEPQRSSLQAVRETIRGIVPEAAECISYGMPAFRLPGGKVVAGLAAFKNHLSYLPHSGSVLKELTQELAGFEFTAGSLHFPSDKPLSKALVKKLIQVRLRQIGAR